MSGFSPLRLRLMTLAFAAAVVFCGAAIRAEGPARATAGSVDRRGVDRLVADLDAESRSVRTAARESLLALGPAILPLLPDERTITSAAARDAVGQIRTRLERQSALATLAASRVDLHGRFPLREILKRFSEQTGNHFDCTAIDPAVLNRKFSVDDRSQTFWNACDVLLEKADLAYAPVLKSGRLALVPASRGRGEREASVAVSGPFRVAVHSVAMRSAFGESSQLLRINWSLRVEPRLRPLFASIAASGLVVTGPHLVTGPHWAIFKPATPGARWELSMGEEMHRLRLDSDFQVPAGAAPASVDFRGSLGIEMAAAPRQIVFDELNSESRQTRRAGSATVSLRSVQFPPPGEKRGSARIEISLAYDQGGPAFESYRTWMYHNEAALETKSGRRIAPGPIVATQRHGDGSVAVEYNFADVQGTPRDYRFLYVAPTLITQVPVEFRLEKLPVTGSALGRISP